MKRIEVQVTFYVEADSVDIAYERVARMIDAKADDIHFETTNTIIQEGEGEQ
jgi:hypothetical protein